MQCLIDKWKKPYESLEFQKIWFRSRTLSTD